MFDWYLVENTQHFGVIICQLKQGQQPPFIFLENNDTKQT
jgi:hypothetical protein